MPPATLALIEDEVPMRRFLRTCLSGAGYRVVEAATAAEGLRVAAQERPDVVLLDLGLPDRDGLEVIARLRQWSSVPILVVSARGQEREKVTALDAGADDYLTKPFGVDELLARVRVARRSRARLDSGGQETAYRFGDVEVDLLRRRVRRAGGDVRLTRLEFALLETLVRHAGRVLTHRFLLKEVWGPHATEQSHYVRVYVSSLRKKLEDNAARPAWLLTDQGVGYRLRVE